MIYISGYTLPVQADAGSCGQREQIVAKLSSGYKETILGQGLTATGTLIEVIVNKETGTWTVIMSWPTGRSCVLSTGENWEDAIRVAEQDVIS